eukprot:Clim_evm19s151 gene=Clim_evmTU19s151
MDARAKEASLRAQIEAEGVHVMDNAEVIERDKSTQQEKEGSALENAWTHPIRIGQKNGMVKADHTAPPPVSSDGSQPEQSPTRNDPLDPEGSWSDTDLPGEMTETERKLTLEQLDLHPGSKLRVMGWNIEWMAHFFKSDQSAEFAQSNKKVDIDDVGALCTSISGVIMDIDPDVLAIQEGPPRRYQMVSFVKTFLGNAFDVFSGKRPEVDIQQRMYVLVKKGGIVRSASVDLDAEKFLNQSWEFDVDRDFILQPYHFTRQPVVVRIEAYDATSRRTVPVVVLSMHTKSKYIHRGLHMWRSGDRDQVMEYIEKAVKNRRRIAAECSRMRRCLDELYYTKDGDGRESAPNIVICGDFNDGPGLDFFEERYILHDSVDALLGSPFYANKLLRAILIRHKWVNPKRQYTVVFNDFVDDVEDRKVLCDHIMCSESMNHTIVGADVAHEAWHRHCIRPPKSEPKEVARFMRQYRPSDHRPVYADFDLARLTTFQPETTQQWRVGSKRRLASHGQLSVGRERQSEKDPPRRQRSPRARSPRR